MTVLYFADTRFPIERANGAQTMATCRALAARGHDVTLVVRPDTASPARDPFEFYALAREPRLTIATVATGGGAFVRRVRYLLQARRHVRRNPNAFVYTRDLGVAVFLLTRAGLEARRLVYESHGIAPVVSQELPSLLGRPDLAPSRAKLARLDRRERLVWRRAGAYVTITRALADDLEARYGARERTFVVPDGADEPAGALPPTPPSKDPLAVYAGHLYPWKGVDVFVRALADAPHVRGLIVGGHPQESDRARVEALAVAHRVRDRLEITGHVPLPEVGRQLARGAMLVLPNTPSTMSERYTSPLKLFEYLWMGLPIIASDLPALREVLSPSTALLVPPGDAIALAMALERLACDQDLRLSLGTAARRLAPEYSWRRRAERLERVLAAAEEAS